MADDWFNSLGRAIEITEGQLALADLVSAGGVRVDAEILRRLVQAAKAQLPPVELDGDEG